MILIHPAADLSQDRRRFLREFTFGIRSYVQDHISTLGNALYQLLDQHGSRFVIMVVCTVSPVVVHGEACFPDHRIAFLIADPSGGMICSGLTKSHGTVSDHTHTGILFPLRWLPDGYR